MSGYYNARSSPAPPPRGVPRPPEPNKRRLLGEIANLDSRSGKGLIASPTGEFSFSLSASLTASDRKQISSWSHGLVRVLVEFSVVAGDEGREEVNEIVVTSVEPLLPVSGSPREHHNTAQSPISMSLAPMLADQDDNALLEVDRSLLQRNDCDDPSLTRHPPMFQIFWELNEYMKTAKQARTVPVVMVRSRLTVNTAIMVILSEKTAVGMDVVTLEDGLILLSVCTGAAVFVFDLPKMHPPERDSIAMWLLTMNGLRPQVPIVSLTVVSLKKLAITYPESFFSCKAQTIGTVDVLQAAQQVLPEISRKARTAEELINMVFGYKHAPRPTKSEDAALSIAFGRPAFHSRQVFAQLNNLARNQSFAMLLDQQALRDNSNSADDASPVSQPGTANAYKRRRLGSQSSISSDASHAIYGRQGSVTVLPEEAEDPEKSAEMFMEWVKNEMKKDGAK